MSFAVRVYLNEGRDPQHLVFGYEEATAVLRLAAEFDVSVVGSPRHALEVVFAELNVDEPFEPWAVGTEHPLKNMTCDVCHDEPMVGVASVPGVPMSVAYGRKCLNANAHPYDIVVANTAAATDNPDDWRLGCADWWRQIVADTCAHLGKTSEQFDADVRAQMAAIAADDRAMHARWGYDEWCMVGPAGDVPGDWDG